MIATTRDGTTTSGGGSAGSSSRDCACQGGLRSRDRPLGPRARLLHRRGGTSRDRGRRAAPGRTATATACWRAPRPSSRSTRKQPRRVYAGSIGNGFFKSVDNGKRWARRFFGSGTQFIRRRGGRPGRPFGVRRDLVRRGHLEEHRLRRHVHPNRPRSQRPSRRVPDVGRPRDHGRSAQPLDRLLRRPRYGHLAIARRRCELDQRRRNARANCALSTRPTRPSSTRADCSPACSRAPTAAPLSRRRTMVFRR